MFNKRFIKKCKEEMANKTNTCKCKSLIGKFNFGIGLNFFTSGKHRQSGSVVLNTGRSSIESQIGITYRVSEKITIPVFINIPMKQKMQGIQNPLRYTISSGIQFNIQTKKKSEIHSHGENEEPHQH